MGTGGGLGEFEHLVMLAVVRLGAGAYGVAVRRELAERGGRAVSPGAVYATLERLEKKGLLASSQGAPTAVRGGRAKTFFKPTRAGFDALIAAREVLDRLWDGLTPGEVWDGKQAFPFVTAKKKLRITMKG